METQLTWLLSQHRRSYFTGRGGGVALENGRSLCTALVKQCGIHTHQWWFFLVGEIGSHFNFFLSLPFLFEIYWSALHLEWLFTQVTFLKHHNLICYMPPAMLPAMIVTDSSPLTLYSSISSAFYKLPWPRFLFTFTGRNLLTLM